MKKKFLISIWADPSNYINLLFLINFLIKKNYEIILICKLIEKKKDFFYFVKKTKKLKIIEINKDNKFGYLKFYYKILLVYHNFRPKVILSINFISLFFNRLVVKNRDKFIYYNFDFELSSRLKFNNLIEEICVKRPNYVFLPSNSRVNLYKKKFRRNHNIFPIYNSFSKSFKIKKTSISKKYNFLKKKNYFVRLGSFYKYHFLKELALSTKYWKKNFFLIMAGKSYEGYFEKLKKYIKKNKLNKVILIKNISYNLWFSLLKNGYGGFALYEQVNTSHRLMGGTSQKLNNYIFSGLPSFVIKSRDIIKFNKKYKTSIVVDSKPKLIAKKVNNLIRNKKLHKYKVYKNKKAFMNEFNFENQILRVEKFLID